MSEQQNSEIKEKKWKKILPLAVLALGIILMAVLLWRAFSGSDRTIEEIDLVDVLSEADANHDKTITGDELETIESPTGGEDAKEEEEKPFQLRRHVRPLRCWIRAKLTYEYDDGIYGLGDSLVRFDSLKWLKADDGWYYYQDVVKSGDVITFIRGLNLPSEWTNDIANKEFSVKVTVEAAEARKGEAGWSENSAVGYQSVYNVWSTNPRRKVTESIKRGLMTVKIHEWQRNEDGSITGYQNDKLVVPGAHISKIVRFELRRVLIRSTGDTAQLGLYLGGLFIAVIILRNVIKRHKKEEKAHEEA